MCHLCDVDFAEFSCTFRYGIDIRRSMSAELGADIGPISSRYQFALWVAIPYIRKKAKLCCSFFFSSFWYEMGKPILCIHLIPWFEVWNGNRLQLHHSYFTHSWAFEYGKCSIFFMSKLQDAKGKFKRTTPTPCQFPIHIVCTNLVNFIFRVLNPSVGR